MMRDTEYTHGWWATGVWYEGGERCTADDDDVHGHAATRRARRHGEKEVLKRRGTLTELKGHFTLPPKHARVDLSLAHLLTSSRGGCLYVDKYGVW